MGRADWTVFHWVNGLAGEHTWLDKVGKAAAEQLAIVIVATLVGGWLLTAGAHLWRDRELPRGLVTGVIVVGVSLGLALLANRIVGDLWFRDRPYVTHSKAHLLVASSPDPSFASDHATAGFALSLGAAGSLPRVAALLFIETVLMSLGRVFVGLHYPGDMLGGLALGGTAALVATLAVRMAGGVMDRVVGVVNGYAARAHWPVRLS